MKGNKLNELVSHSIRVCLALALYTLSVANFDSTTVQAAAATTANQLLNETKSSDNHQQAATPKTSFSVSTSIVQHSSAVLPTTSTDYSQIENNNNKRNANHAKPRAAVIQFKNEDALRLPPPPPQAIQLQQQPPRSSPQVQSYHSLLPVVQGSAGPNGKIIDYSSGGADGVHHFHHHYVHDPTAASPPSAAANQLFVAAQLPYSRLMQTQKQPGDPSQQWPSKQTSQHFYASPSSQLQEYQRDAPVAAAALEHESLARSYGSSTTATSTSTNEVNSSSNNQQALEHWQARSRHAKCPTRSLGSVLKSAKHLLTDGFASIEQRTTTGNLVFGSGLLAAAIPLIALVLPDSSSSSLPKRSLIDQVVGAFSTRGGGGGLQGRVESMMGWVERSIEHLPHFPRLHPQECVKRSICEAHNEPDKHGAIGLLLRAMFPASNLNSTSQMDNMEYKVINKYRHAASYGFTKRLDEDAASGTNGAVCKDKYEDCLISLLDVAKKLVDLFII